MIGEGTTVTGVPNHIALRILIKHQRVALNRVDIILIVEIKLGHLEMGSGLQYPISGHAFKQLFEQSATGVDPILRNVNIGRFDQRSNVCLARIAINFGKSSDSLIITAFVAESASKAARQSINEVPGTGSPPIPTQVVQPIPFSLSS